MENDIRTADRSVLQHLQRSFKRKADAEKALPSSLNLVEKAGLAAGRNILFQISPSYLTVERYYYKSGHPDFKKAYELVKFRRWEDAARLWHPHLSDEDLKIRAMAANNLAIVAERKGELEHAINLIEQASDWYPTQEILSYKLILQNRIDR